MFYDTGNICRSSCLDSVTGIKHAFSTRLGGVSREAHTREMNLAPGHGDSDETVLKNVDIFVRLASDGMFCAHDAVLTHQIHSSRIRTIGISQRGEGATRPSGADCDGFICTQPGIVPIVRSADCVPILLAGLRHDETPVVAALHAGWRGSVADIVGEAIAEFNRLGVPPERIHAAIGAHIGSCCFEIGSDVIDTICDLHGAEFAERHMIRSNGHVTCDLTGINRELLLRRGVRAENIDASDECTMCMPEKYHSHRRGHGLRGAMGSCIMITSEHH